MKQDRLVHMPWLCQKNLFFFCYVVYVKMVNKAALNRSSNTTCHVSRYDPERDYRAGFKDLNKNKSFSNMMNE